ncbi:hypothetical protein PSU4_43170 [Pseudonocardia sulfidoxydans NBRC 16205]|uniref:Uncharacterized protein n=2 Tax=Pseudonocardia sulfidoxydans TaxID=54011 RepID=A0A511DM82_9PSEU|nr:hypothetical protein [Pseudonocardia sulfidoxydans]GEL25363.1 hypothetical protein PSU4_43170 [Pseudonocardia sulfidoxydans NBRC 16205]
MERPAAGRHPLQTLVRTRRGFVVFDPRIVEGTHYSIDDHGALVHDRVPAGATLGVVVAAGAAGALFLGDGWWKLAWLVAGLLVGAVLAALLLAIVDLVDSPERRYRKLTGSRRFSRNVTDTTDPSTWQLCVLGSRVADSRAWRTGLIDPDRLLGPLLWSAVSGDDSGETVRDTLTELADVATELDATGPVPGRRRPSTVTGQDDTLDPVVVLRARADALRDRLRCA